MSLIFLEVRPYSQDIVWYTTNYYLYWIAYTPCNNILHSVRLISTPLNCQGGIITKICLVLTFFCSCNQFPVWIIPYRLQRPPLPPPDTNNPKRKTIWYLFLFSFSPIFWYFSRIYQNGTFKYFDLRFLEWANKKFLKLKVSFLKITLKQFDSP